MQPTPWTLPSASPTVSRGRAAPRPGGCAGRFTHPRRSREIEATRSCCASVVMVQAAEDGMRNHIVAHDQIRGASRAIEGVGASLADALVGPARVGNRRGTGRGRAEDGPPRRRRGDRDTPVALSRSSARSATGALGAITGVRITRTPAPLATSSKTVPNLASLSRRRNLDLDQMASAGEVAEPATLRWEPWSQRRRGGASIRAASRRRRSGTGTKGREPRRGRTTRCLRPGS